MSLSASSFNDDFGVGPEGRHPEEHQDGEMFGLSVFLRHDDDIYRAHFTDRRGVEPLGSVWTFASGAASRLRPRTAARRRFSKPPACAPMHTRRLVTQMTIAPA